MNFRQGDAEALKRARTGFTNDGWQAFMKWMQGFLDENGAPTFTSNFVPSGSPVVTGSQKGMIHLQLAGTLTQTQGASRTTYHHSGLDVQAVGHPVKIQRLQVIYKLK